MESTEVHISSLVVYARPEQLTAVRQAIAVMPGIEIHAESACGKLVVVVESRTQNYITDTIEKITGLPDVLNTALVYHHIEALES